MSDQLRSIFAMKWRLCPRFPAYEVSECGDVRRAEPCRSRRAGNRPRGFIDPDGYLRYKLTDADGNSVDVIAHRLVAEAFIGPPPSDLHEVAHCNGSRVGMHYSILRWALRVENHADMLVHGTDMRGERNGRAKITEDDVRFIRREYRAIKSSRGKRSVRELDERFGIDRSTTVSIATGKSWSHIPVDRPSDMEAAA